MEKFEGKKYSKEKTAIEPIPADVKTILSTYTKEELKKFMLQEKLGRSMEIVIRKIK